MAAEPEISRRTLLKGTAALGAGLALGPAGGATRQAWYAQGLSESLS